MAAHLPEGVREWNEEERGVQDEAERDDDGEDSGRPRESIHYALVAPHRVHIKGGLVQPIRSQYKSLDLLPWPMLMQPEECERIHTHQKKKVLYTKIVVRRLKANGERAKGKEQQLTSISLGCQ